MACARVNPNLIDPEWQSLGIALGCARVNPKREFAVTVGLPRLRKRPVFAFKMESQMFSPRILLHNWMASFGLFALKYGQFCLGNTAFTLAGLGPS